MGCLYLSSIYFIYLSFVYSPPVCCYGYKWEDDNEKEISIVLLNKFYYYYKYFKIEISAWTGIEPWNSFFPCKRAYYTFNCRSDHSWIYRTQMVEKGRAETSARKIGLLIPRQRRRDSLSKINCNYFKIWVLLLYVYFKIKYKKEFYLS